MKRFTESLFQPVDIASTVFFRIAFGIIMLFEMIAYFKLGFIESLWIEPDFHFKYRGFEWIHPLPGNGMYYLGILVGILAVFIAVGFFYRISIALFFISFTYMFLLEEAKYLNHYYFVILLSFLMVFIPANRAFSVDSILNRKIKSDTIPAWCLWIIIFQMSVVYFYGGIAKLNYDWVNAQPLQLWIQKPVIYDRFLKNFFRISIPNSDIITCYGAYFLSYGGLFFDLTISHFMLWKRTRIYAFITVIAFHFINTLLFFIGIFPITSVVATSLFFDPGWPRKIANRLFNKEFSFKPEQKIHDSGKTGLTKKTILAFLSFYVLFQLLFPLRHYLYDGNVHWTEEGHKFSWHMKLRGKKGEIYYIVRDPVSGKEWTVNPAEELSKRQSRKITGRPGLIHQYAAKLEEDFRDKDFKNVEVRAVTKTSLNGRNYQPIVYENVDLTEVEYKSFRHNTWITPLYVPLNERLEKN